VDSVDSVDIDVRAVREPPLRRGLPVRRGLSSLAGLGRQQTAALTPRSQLAATFIWEPQQRPRPQGRG